MLGEVGLSSRWIEVGCTDLGWCIWGSVMGYSLDLMGHGIVDGQMLMVRVFTEVETMGLSAWGGVTTLEMVGPGRMEPINEAE